MNTEAEIEPGYQYRLLEPPILVLSARRGFSEEEYLSIFDSVTKKRGLPIIVINTGMQSPDQFRTHLTPDCTVIVDAFSMDYFIQAGLPPETRANLSLVYRNRLGHPHGDFRDAVNSLLKLDPDYILSGGEFDIHGHLVV